MSSKTGVNKKRGGGVKKHFVECRRYSQSVVRMGGALQKKIRDAHTHPPEGLHFMGDFQTKASIFIIFEDNVVVCLRGSPGPVIALRGYRRHCAVIGPLGPMVRWAHARWPLVPHILACLAPFVARECRLTLNHAKCCTELANIYVERGATGCTRN